jgi:hypothetical protein
MPIRCGDSAVLRGHVSLPLVGAWHATLELDAAEAPSGAVVLAADDGFELHAAVVHGGVQSDRAFVRIVGGAGGLGATVSGAFRSAKLRDPLRVITTASGDTLSSTIASSLLTLSLPYWTLGVYPAWRALSELAAFADVSWRYLPDGTLWLGEEAWTAATLPEGDAIASRHPAQRRTVIATSTPSLLPGVDLEGVGQVHAVEHWIEPYEVRTWAWG